MYAPHLLTHIIKPALNYMGYRYNSKDAQMLLLATAAIESKCGYYVKQLSGPANGIWQMEPATSADIYKHCDALQEESFLRHIDNLVGPVPPISITEAIYPLYACALARLKYAMDPKPLPRFDEMEAIYTYYKRIYNTVYGASTFAKFEAAWYNCKLDEVKL